MRVLLFLAALSAAPCAASPELVSIPSRPGVTPASVILPMTIGGAGRINARREDGQVKFGARNFLPRSAADYGAIRTPLLFVHHRDEGCEHTPYAGAAQLASRYQLFGVEAASVDAIAAWMLKRPVPKQVP